MKSLWASIQGDPVFMQRVNGWLKIFWIAMIPISIATGWINSITYVASLSLWALVSGHWSAWQAARVEVAQKQEAERKLPKTLLARSWNGSCRRPPWRSRGRRGASRLSAPERTTLHSRGLSRLIGSPRRTASPVRTAGLARHSRQKPFGRKAPRSGKRCIRVDGKTHRG